MNQPPALQKPGMLTVLGIVFLIDGILNILWGLGIALALLSTLVGILCLPLAAYPIVLGILEIVYSAKILPNPPKPVQPAMYLAIMCICNIVFGELLSVGAGIFALLAFNNTNLLAYLAQLKATQIPYSSSPAQSGTETPPR